jgi:hypothetical protein
MIDPKAIKPGDEVTVRGRVRYADGPENFGIEFDHVTARKATHYVHPSAIATHTPAPREWKKGDRAMWGGGKVTIRAVDGADAWVCFSDGSGSSIVSADRLTPIPQDGEQ